MRTSQEIQDDCANLLRNARSKAGMSINKLSELSLISRPTLVKYESGASAPSVVDFIRIMDILGESLGGAFTSLVYPGFVKGLAVTSDLAAMRAALSEYFLRAAPDELVRDWDYVMAADSPHEAYIQLQELVTLKHLPAKSRYVVYELLNDLYSLYKPAGKLIDTDRCMPDEQAVFAELRKIVREHIVGSGDEV